MQIRIIAYSLLATCLVFQTLKAQDVHFSQYAETPSSINPALAGVTYNTRIVGNYKTQWSSLGTGSQYQTLGFSFDQTIKFKKLKSNYFAVAANVFKDQAGDAKLSTLNPNLGFTYHQRINKQMKISGGLQSGLFYRTIDVSKLKWGEQYNGYSYDATLPSGEPNVPRSAITSFDLGGGVNLNFVQNDRFLSAKNAARFDVGVSAYHFNVGKSSFITPSENLNTRFCTYFNGEFTIPGTRNALLPSILFMHQNPSTEVIMGMLFKFFIGDASTYTSNHKALALSLGGYYRYNDALIPSMLMQWDKYAVGISYDLNISALTPATKRNGGLEVMLRYNIFPGYGVNMGRSDSRPSY
ncbi:MAG TPA: PorP/SprF family type IX secretion system membrane protein [Bacteroidia bacterium]|nr:PorP/SprF family type IX secretion system membrane protein [Bacteroidia bacterium]